MVGNASFSLPPAFRISGTGWRRYAGWYGESCTLLPTCPAADSCSVCGSYSAPAGLYPNCSGGPSACCAKYWKYSRPFGGAESPGSVRRPFSARLRHGFHDDLPAVRRTVPRLSFGRRDPSDEKSDKPSKGGRSYPDFPQ